MTHTISAYGRLATLSTSDATAEVELRRDRVELSQEPFQTETEISSDDAQITGSVTCESLKRESWFEIRTEQCDRAGYHTRDR